MNLEEKEMHKSQKYLVLQALLKMNLLNGQKKLFLKLNFKTNKYMNNFHL